ncbi:hypothetical protein M1Z46_002014 [Clostridium perfringens]
MWRDYPITNKSDAREKISNILHVVGSFTDVNFGYEISEIFESNRKDKKEDYLKVKRYNLGRNLYNHHGIYC